MKTLIAILSLYSSFALAVPANCGNLAERAVRTGTEYSDRYVGEDVSAFECALAPNGGAVLCGVVASKGDGDATDEWRVVLNKTCTKVLRIDLIGEE